MNLRFIFLFLGGIWSEEYFDSGQSPSHEAHEIVLQVSEFTSHGKHTNNKKRVILEQNLEVTAAPHDEEGIPQSQFNTFQFYQAPPSFSGSEDLSKDQPEVQTDAEDSEYHEAEVEEASGDNKYEYDEEMAEKTNEPRHSKQPREKQPRPSRVPKVKPSREPKQQRSTREPKTSRSPRSTKEPRTSRAPKPTKAPKPSKVPRVKPTRPIRIKTTKAPKTRSEWVSTTVVTTTSTTAEYDYFENYEDYGSEDEEGFNYEEAYAQAAAEAEAFDDVDAHEYEDQVEDYFFNATSSGFPGDGETRRKKPKPTTDQIEFRVNANECRVLPSNCNPAKFNFVDCTNENKFVWQNKDKCKFVSTQDQAWRWRSIMCKCRRNNEDKKMKCGLETAFEYTDGGSKVNAKNKTVPHGKWSSFRRDNGRLDWRPVTLQTPCGQIGRAVAECPSLQDKPFYIDRSAGTAGFKFGDVARMKCPNKIIEDGNEIDRVWKIKCGVGQWFHENGTSIEHVPLWDVCRTNWGSWSEWGSCSSSCDGGKITRTRKCFYGGECAITNKDSTLCIDKRPVRDDFCEGAESANSENMPCNVGVKCIQWAMWSKWSRPDNKCEGRRFRQCQNCLADGTCTPIPKFKQSCAGERFETLFYTNKPACKYFLSIEHGGNITIFDTRRGKINTLEGGIKGLPTKSPFVRTDCTIKHNGEIYVVGAIKGVAEMSLYKTDRETSRWKKEADLPQKVFRSSCESFEGRLWRCGGFLDSERTIRSNKCYSYSFEEKIWSEEVDMNNQRAMHSMIRSGSKLYVFGGTGAEESTGEVYSVKDGIWGVFSWSVPMNNGVSMEPGSPVVIRGKNTNNQEQIWFAGGATRDTANDVIWRFTPKDNKMSRMGKMLQPRYRVSLLFSSRQLDRNAAGRGRHQLMVDGGNHPDRDADPLVRELCDIWEWTEENVSSQTCQGVDRLDEIPPYTASLNWP